MGCKDSRHIVANDKINGQGPEAFKTFEALKLSGGTIDALFCCFRKYELKEHKGYLNLDELIAWYGIKSFHLVTLLFRLHGLDEYRQKTLVYRNYIAVNFFEYAVCVWNLLT